MTPNRFRFRVWMRGEVEDGRCSGKRDMSFRMWHDDFAIIDGIVYRYSPCESDFVETDKEDDEPHIMQSTGLCDKNGKEIFEDDIVRYTAKRQRVLSAQTQRVLWIPAASGFKPFALPDLWNPKDTKIIGNIHENPDLRDVGTLDQEV